MRRIVSYGKLTYTLTCEQIAWRDAGLERYEEAGIVSYGKLTYTLTCEQIAGPDARLERYENQGSSAMES